MSRHSPIRAEQPGSASLRARAASSINVEGVAALVALLVAWQVASAFLPPLIFPPLQTIAGAVGATFSDPAAFGVVAVTYLRIVAWLAASFLLSTAIGIWAARHPRLDRAIVPVIQLKQGIPGIIWALFAIIWFEEMETRIAFVVMTSTLPSLFFQARDGFRAIPHDLWEMVRALRPSPGAMFVKLTLPGMLPSMLTGLRINLGTAARVTITAELLAGISGIGYQLRAAQEQFRIDEVLAWTIPVALFVLLTDYGMGKLEAHLLRWRRAPEAAQ